METYGIGRCVIVLIALLSGPELANPYGLNIEAYLYVFRRGCCHLISREHVALSCCCLGNSGEENQRVFEPCYEDKSSFLKIAASLSRSTYCLGQKIKL